jgi:hypothetical protein
MKLVERMPRVCKPVKATGGCFEESKIYFDTFKIQKYRWFDAKCIIHEKHFGTI